MRTWRPLSQRDTDAADEELFEGVPFFLVPHLYDWLSEKSGVTTEQYKMLGIVLRFHVDTNTPRDVYASITDYCGDDEQQFLDVLDAVLKFCDVPNAETYALDSLLQLGGSAWRVASDGTGLERRVDESTVAAHDMAVAGAVPTSSQHLSTAWRKTYGRQPDPAVAYSEAVKAIETAAAPVVIPNDPKPTLGKVLSAIEAKPSKFNVAIEDDHASEIGPVVKLMRMMWRGHAGRHGGPGPTQAQADMAVHAASTLVHWFSSGAVSRTS